VTNEPDQTRDQQWVSTMAGFEQSSITLAHADSWAGIGTKDIVDRSAREALLDAAMAPLATLSGGPGIRAIAEEPDPLRTCFERDRDRILHASSFRRLAGKTQVFVFPDDHQRTRLTHALEVAQVAVSVARVLRLNVSLTEAIALGHDCGHGPGGHASEDALSPYIDGGYDHAVWGADVALLPLNLCVETLDGIRNHSWSRPAPQTPEGEIVSWADRIAYVCHDFEDAVDAGIVSPADLPHLVSTRCGTTRREQLNAFINGMVLATAHTGRIGMVPDTAEALALFRQFNYERIYHRDESRAQAQSVIDMLRALVDHYIQHPQLLPSFEDTPCDPHSATATHEAVAYVGGMTDRFACRQAVMLLDYPRHRLPQGIDTLLSGE
jgi:dGTPase